MERKSKTRITNKMTAVSGITLIALVVTIIVLLILAGVAISLSIGITEYLKEHKMQQIYGKMQRK